MIKEVSVAGIYVSPIAVYLVAAGGAFLPLRWVFDRVGIQRIVWHRALFDLAVYVILLSVITLLF